MALILNLLALTCNANFLQWFFFFKNLNFEGSKLHLVLEGYYGHGYCKSNFNAMKCLKTAIQLLGIFDATRSKLQT